MPGSEPSLLERSVAVAMIAKWTTTDAYILLTEAGDLVITEPRSSGYPQEVLRFHASNRPEIKLASKVVALPDGETDDRPNKFHGGNYLAKPSRLLAITPQGASGKPDESHRHFIWCDAQGVEELVNWSTP